MIVLALVLFFLLFLKVRSYKECMGGGTTSGGASNSVSGGGFAGRSYGVEGMLDGVYRDMNPHMRLEGAFTRCSPESCPTGSGPVEASIIVPGRGNIPYRVTKNMF